MTNTTNGLLGIAFGLIGSIGTIFFLMWVNAQPHITYGVLP